LKLKNQELKNKISKQDSYLKERQIEDDLENEKIREEKRVI